MNNPILEFSKVIFIYKIYFGANPVHHLDNQQVAFLPNYSVMSFQGRIEGSSETRAICWASTSGMGREFFSLYKMAFNGHGHKDEINVCNCRIGTFCSIKFGCHCHLQKINADKWKSLKWLNLWLTSMRFKCILAVVAI